MGRGRGGRGGKSKGKGKGKESGSQASWSAAPYDEDEAEEYGDERWDEWDEWDDGWEASSRRPEPSYGAHESSWAPHDAMLARPLAAQWRFVCRVLRRHAPEERVLDPRREIRLGDHVFAQFWGSVEHHGIICSSNSDESHARRSSREDPNWVVHWEQEGSRLQCTALSQFMKGGELFRMSYPHWVCQCYIPVSSTMKPHISSEHYLEADRPEAVAKRANTAYRNGAWSASWSQSADIEFCIGTKTGSSPPIEMHGRKTLSTSFQWPLGCAIGGEPKPSIIFGVGRAGGSGTPGSPVRGTAAAPPPGYPEQAPQWSPAMPSQAISVSTLEGKFSDSQAYAPGGMWPDGQNWNSWQANSSGPNSKSGKLSADAQEFVPGTTPAVSPNWDGIYQ